MKVNDSKLNPLLIFDDYNLVSLMSPPTNCWVDICWFSLGTKAQLLIVIFRRAVRPFQRETEIIKFGPKPEYTRLPLSDVLVALLLLLLLVGRYWVPRYVFKSLGIY
jgi:hypothetical protein